MKLERIDDVGDCPLCVYTGLTLSEREAIRNIVRAERTPVEGEITQIQVYDYGESKIEIVVSYISKSKVFRMTKEIRVYRSNLDGEYRLVDED